MKSSNEIASELNPIYYSIGNPASFSSAKSLKYETKEKKIPRKAISNWLSEQETHSMHKPIRRNFQRRRVIVSGIDDQWQADLADLSTLRSRNKGNRYLLGCIDVFSKYAWVVPLKSKSAKDVLQGLKKILKDGRKPRKLQTDMGGEFTNSKMQAFLKSEGISFFFTQNQDIKASIIERFWRTLKSRMYKYFTYKGGKKYIDILPDLVSSYNNTLHGSIKMPPSCVNTNNEEKVWHTLYGSKPLVAKRALYKVGDFVRIGKYKGAFDKGYIPNWSREIFNIKRIMETLPHTYVIEDQNHEEMKGSFYEEELQSIKSLPEEFKIEQIVARRRKSGKRQVLIKWLDYPESFNSWISEVDIIQY